MSTPTALPAPGTGWVITSQTPTIGFVGNQTAPGYNINFTTGRGHPGTLFVPMTNYNQSSVQGLITSLATTIDQVGSLTG